MLPLCQPVPDDNAGKTAFLLNFIRLNMDDFGIYYFSSEMGEQELALRLSKFEGITIDEWNFTAEERNSNFADVIRPDCVNVVDYLEINTDFHIIAEYIRQIHDRLNSGIAFIAIQKDKESELGRGRTFSLEKARLYLTMDPGVLKLVKGKNWANRELNPNNKRIRFKIVDGCKFIQESDWEE